MNPFRGPGLMAAVIAAFAGCDKPNSMSAPPAKPAFATNAPAHLDHAQPKLTTLKLWLGTQEIVAEMAVTQTQIATGMMFRETMAENEGMLFIFGRPHRTAFYMRNTRLPLSCAYIDSEGTILEIHDMKPLDETPIDAASDKVQYVLEVKQGWFQRNKVGVGVLVRTEHGSFEETFFKR